ncbi:hypothetical protein BT96DRAFT_986545 [Gymnopus androsaceus JB14]|uniref:Uncharacterized protein n=1 Tax=Gymnopus androsaceus JB14 TaxID=1447944 RepID=A0A6A4IAA6_9AGAR|nr:hypothetical protein BT96DRAFT_986545 [Gymnopus androsaceus JB14]
MQSKLIIALALSCLSAFVAASPIPAPAPAVQDSNLARARVDESPVAREEVEEREPICRYDCI